MDEKYVLVNMDKNEYIDPARLSCCGSFREFGETSLAHLFFFLVRRRDGGGRDDWRYSVPQAGRWAGDRVALVGGSDSSGLYGRVTGAPGWCEVSPVVVQGVNRLVRDRSMVLVLDFGWRRAGHSERDVRLVDLPGVRWVSQGCVV